jgi:hypothetical protein
LVGAGGRGRAGATCAVHCAEPGALPCCSVNPCRPAHQRAEPQTLPSAATPPSRAVGGTRPVQRAGSYQPSGCTVQAAPLSATHSRRGLHRGERAPEPRPRCAPTAARSEESQGGFFRFHSCCHRRGGSGGAAAASCLTVHPRAAQHQLRAGGHRPFWLWQSLRARSTRSPARGAPMHAKGSSCAP